MNTLIHIDFIKKKYKHLYYKLKAEAVDVIDKIEVPDNVKQELIEIISNLPHPRVATILDIEEVCRGCVSGKLESLYRYFGDEAREILDETEKERAEEIPQPSRPERYSIENVGNMLAWTNKAVYRQMFMLSRISTVIDKTLKGICPSCGYDLIMVIVDGKKLRLRCRNPECGLEWSIQKVSPAP